MNPGDVVWWTGAAPCRPRKVRLVKPAGDGFLYQTVGGATGWQARASRDELAPLAAYKRNGQPR